MTSDRKDLKIQALLEKVSELTTSYENRVADLRVELTLAGEQLQEANTQIQQLQQASAEQASSVTDVQPQIVEGEVVQETATPVSS